MNSRLSFLPSLLLLILPVLAYSQQNNSPSSDPDPLHTWIDRSWEIRYFLSVTTENELRIAAKVAHKRNQPVVDGKPEFFQMYEGIFEATSVIPVKGSYDPFAIIAITFDRNGEVLTPHKGPQPLIGKRNVLRNVALVPPNTSNVLPYRLGYWFMGFPGDERLFSPALCSINDDHRYRKDFSRRFVSKYSADGNFGCREWTYQLYDAERPYIDVTSYQRDGTYIKEFIGWSRFEDPPKPVIGRHEKAWYCLHECPADEAPGIIADIKAWAKQHGYPLPRRPRKQPMFPDADFAGYIDD